MSNIKMQRVDGHVWPDHPEPGSFNIYEVEGGASLSFIMPNGKHCGIAISRDPSKEPRPFGLAADKVWTWNGDSEKPTCTPSILCNNCGWHGYITNGELVTV